MDRFFTSRVKLKHSTWSIPRQTPTRYNKEEKALPTPRSRWNKTTEAQRADFFRAKISSNSFQSNSGNASGKEMAIETDAPTTHNRMKT